MKKSSIALQFGIPFLGTVLVSGVLIWFLGNWASNTIANNYKDTLFTSVEEKLKTKIDNFMQQPQEIIQLNAKKLELNKGPVDKSEMSQLLFAQLQQRDAVASIEYADESGKSFGVGRNILEVPYIYWESDRSNRNTGEAYELFEDFSKGSKILSVFEDYDVRERSWYLTAKERQTPSWTEIYPWPTGNIVGLDAIMRVDRGEEPDVVLDASITLEKLRTFLAEIDPQHISDSYILESDGNIVAGTDIASPVKVTSEEVYERINAIKSDSTQLREVYEIILRNGGLTEMAGREQKLVSKLSGSYYFKVIPYTDAYGLSWYVVTIISRSVVFQAVDQSRLGAILLITCILLFASVASYLVTRKATDPLIQFSKGIRRFSETGSLDKLPEAKSKEMDELTRTFINMSRKLTNQFRKLEDNEFSIALENEKLKRVLESIGEGVVVIDSNQEIVLINKIAAKLGGVRLSSAIGKQFDVAFHFSENGKKPFKTFGLLEAAMAENNNIVLPDSLVIIDSKNNVTPVHCSGSPIHNADGSLFGYVMVLRDVNEMRRVDRAKTDILSVASHQLRTPLSAVKWNSELLLNMKANIPKEQFSAIQSIHRANDRMIDLVNTLLSASQFELGVLDIKNEELNLETYITDLVRQFKVMATEKGVEMKLKIVKPLQKFHGDRKLMGIIVSNLISNAIKYNRQNGKVAITVKHDGKVLELQVEDTGIGISNKDQEMIFTKLYRGEEAKLYSPDGNGLGLYIVRSIVENLRGHITFDSVPGIRSVFVVTLPGKEMMSVKK